MNAIGSRVLINNQKGGPMTPTILVLGGAGLVGDAVACRLLASSFPTFKVVVADPREPLVRQPGIEYIIGKDVNAFDPSLMQGLIARVQPIAIIDAVNDATLAIKHSDISKAVTDYVFGVLLPIVREGIVLVDIGTSATGGMGMNLGFTHNEATDDGNIAPNLILKNVAASIHGGLLDLMGRTPGYRVGRVVPRGMVGFEPPFYGPITVEKNIPQQAASQFVSKTAPHNVQFQLDSDYVGVGVRCGENGEFGLEETVAITAIGMMETVSAEAVAAATMDVLFRLFANAGSYVQHDLHPDMTSLAQRQRIIKQMTELCDANQTHSVAFSNLGPYLTTELWELLVLRLLGFTPRTLAANISADLKVSQHGDVTSILSVALPGLGFPVITDHYFCPARLNNAKKVTVEDITEQMRRVDLTGSDRLWAVDLRQGRMRYWEEAARTLLATKPDDFKRSHLPGSWDELIRPGSFWAAYATVTGHGRGDFSAGSRY